MASEMAHGGAWVPSVMASGAAPVEVKPDKSHDHRCCISQRALFQTSSPLQGQLIERHNLNWLGHSQKPTMTRGRERNYPTNTYHSHQGHHDHHGHRDHNYCTTPNGPSHPAPPLALIFRPPPWHTSSMKHPLRPPPPPATLSPPVSRFYQRSPAAAALSSSPMRTTPRAGARDFPVTPTGPPPPPACYVPTLSHAKATATHDPMMVSPYSIRTPSSTSTTTPPSSSRRVSFPEYNYYYDGPLRPPQIVSCQISPTPALAHTPPPPRDGTTMDTNKNNSYYDKCGLLAYDEMSMPPPMPQLSPPSPPAPAAILSPSCHEMSRVVSSTSVLESSTESSDDALPLLVSSATKHDRDAIHDQDGRAAECSQVGLQRTSETHQPRWEDRSDSTTSTSLSAAEPPETVPFPVSMPSSHDARTLGATSASASTNSNSNSTACSSALKPQSISAFPDRLRGMLDDAETLNFDHIVSWFPDGKAFRVHEPRAFVSDLLIKKYSNQTKYKSFQRQLNLYGFERFTTGPRRGGYSHPLFTRDQPNAPRLRRLREGKIVASPKPKNSNVSEIVSLQVEPIADVSVSCDTTSSQSTSRKITPRVPTTAAVNVSELVGRISDGADASSVFDAALGPAGLLFEEEEFDLGFFGEDNALSFDIDFSDEPQDEDATIQVASTRNVRSSLHQSNFQSNGFAPDKPQLEHSFAWRVYDMLQDSDTNNFTQIVSWCSDSSFKVHKHADFVSIIMPHYFGGQHHYESFRRQLNAYGFVRERRGPNRGTYSHENLKRGDQACCYGIQRVHASAK